MASIAGTALSQSEWQVREWRGVHMTPRNSICLLDAPTHTQAIKMMDFWHARPKDGLRMGRDVPSRQIAGLLGNIMVMEPVANYDDWTINHAGEAVAHRFGAHAKGRIFSSLFLPEEVSANLALMRNVVEKQEAAVMDSVLHSDAVELMHLEVVILPVHAHDGVGRWTMAGLFYFR